MTIDWTKIPESAGLRAGSARKGICGDLLSAVRIETAPGTRFDGRTHWHENEQILVMVSGTGRVVIVGKESDVWPGDMVFFPARARHAVIGCGPEGCVYYEIFSPARPDMLPGWLGQPVTRFD